MSIFYASINRVLHISIHVSYLFLLHVLLEIHKIYKKSIEIKPLLIPSSFSFVSFVPLQWITRNFCIYKKQFKNSHDQRCFFSFYNIFVDLWMNNNIRRECEWKIFINYYFHDEDGLISLKIFMNWLIETEYFCLIINLQCCNVIGIVSCWPLWFWRSWDWNLFIGSFLLYFGVQALLDITIYFGNNPQLRSLS